MKDQLRLLQADGAETEGDKVVKAVLSVGNIYHRSLVPMII